jgi:hypothetical protein
MLVDDTRLVILLQTFSMTNAQITLVRHTLHNGACHKLKLRHDTLHMTLRHLIKCRHFIVDANINFILKQLRIQVAPSGGGLD